MQINECFDFVTVAFESLLGQGQDYLVRKGVAVMILNDRPNVRTVWGTVARWSLSSDQKERVSSSFWLWQNPKSKAPILRVKGSSFCFLSVILPYV